MIITARPRGRFPGLVEHYHVNLGVIGLPQIIRMRRLGRILPVVLENVGISPASAGCWWANPTRL